MSADFFPSERWRYTMTEYLGVSSGFTNKKGIFTDRESAWIEEYIHARSRTVLFPLLLCLTLVNCSEFLTPVVILPSRILAPSSCLSAPFQTYHPQYSKMKMRCQLPRHWKRAVHAPLRPICKAILHRLFILRSSLVILNTLFLLSRMTRAHTTLTAWANTVAMAAPAA